MRVLLTHTATLPRAHGGSERVVWELARGLAARDHDVKIVARRTLASSAGIDRGRAPVRRHCTHEVVARSQHDIYARLLWG